MKNLVILITLVFCLISNSFGSCAEMHAKLASVIPTQKVTICRISGMESEGPNLLGMYFKMGSVDALLVYGVDYEAMLYIDGDYPVSHTKCIINDEYRAIHPFMTSDQIAYKLMAQKKCEANYAQSHERGYTRIDK